MSGVAAGASSGTRSATVDISLGPAASEGSAGVSATACVPAGEIDGDAKNGNSTLSRALPGFGTPSSPAASIALRLVMTMRPGLIFTNREPRSVTKWLPSVGGRGGRYLSTIGRLHAYPDHVARDAGGQREMPRPHWHLIASFLSSNF